MDPSGGGVIATVTVFPSDAAALASFAASGAPLAPSCKAAAMRAEFLTKGYAEIVSGAFLPTGISGRTTMLRETVRTPNTSSTTHEDFLYGERGPVLVYLDIQSSLDTKSEIGLLAATLDRLTTLGITSAN